MRNLNTFSEFQFGLVKTLAEVSGLKAKIDSSLIQLVHPDTGSVEFEWQYGQAPMLCDDNHQLVPVAEFADTIAALYRTSQEPTDSLADLADALDEWLNDESEDDNG